MSNLFIILTNIRAAIAAHAARERSLAVLLVAVWGRVARMGTRLVALWRAGALPKPRPVAIRVEAAAPLALADFHASVAD